MLVTTDKHRGKLEERAVALVGFGDQVLGLADAGIGAESIHAPANDDCRIKSSGGQDRGNHRGRRRLAVHARNRDAVLQPHQLSQHLSARDYRNVEFVGFDDFGILLRDRGTGHNDFRAGDVSRGVAFEDRGSQIWPDAG